jgi:hypothetical protein
MTPVKKGLSLSSENKSFTHRRGRAAVMFAVIPLACITHIVRGLFFGGQEQWPVVEIVLISAAVIALLRMLVATRPLRFGLLALNIFGWLVVIGFLWWTQSYSSYPKMSVNISEGENVGGVFSASHTIPAPADSAVLLDTITRPSENVPAPIKIELALPEEEEVFLDASGKSFQLTPAPVTRQEEITTTAPPKSGDAISLKPEPFFEQSDATLVVFFRGWW